MISENKKKTLEGIAKVFEDVALQPKNYFIITASLMFLKCKSPVRNLNSDNPFNNTISHLRIQVVS